MSKKPPKKWRITIFWSAIGLILFDLLRRPVTYIVQTWRSDIFHQEIRKMTHGEVAKFEELSGFAEHFASLMGFLVCFFGLIFSIAIIVAALIFSGHLIKLFYSWAYDD